MCKEVTEAERRDDERQLDGPAAVRLGTASVDRLDATEDDELEMPHYVVQTIGKEYAVLLHAATVLLMSRRNQPGLPQARVEEDVKTSAVPRRTPPRLGSLVCEKDREDQRRLTKNFMVLMHNGLDS